MFDLFYCYIAPIITAPLRTYFNCVLSKMTNVQSKHPCICLIYTVFNSGNSRKIAKLHVNRNTT